MGPLQYRIGTHALGQLRHEERPEDRAAGNMLAFGQTIPPSSESGIPFNQLGKKQTFAKFLIKFRNWEQMYGPFSNWTLVISLDIELNYATGPAWDDDAAFPVAVAAPLAPGEASIHNFSLVHRHANSASC